MFSLQNERCRLCGMRGNDTTILETNLTSRIKILFHLEIKEDDKLTKNICRNCMSSVNSCWILYLQIHRVQHELATENDFDEKVIKQEVEEVVSQISNDPGKTIVPVSDLGQIKVSTKKITSESDDILLEFPMWCCICSEIFVDRESYNLHPCFEKHRTYFCVDCSKAFSIHNQLIKHIKIYHWERLKTHLLRQCDVCSLWFQNQSDQEAHRKQEHPDAKSRDEPEMPLYFNLLTCQVCGKICDNRSSLKRHMLKHSDKLPCVCDTCGKTFRFAWNLKEHTITQHGKGGDMLYCDQCGKKFHTKKFLKNHMMVHSKERPFACDICNKTFKAQYIVELHKRIHSEKKLFVCETCGKGCNSKGNLGVHKKRHTEDRQHKCSFCEKGFKTKIDRIIHERQHTGEQPYGCTFCDRKFVSSGNRLKHMRRIHKADLNEKAKNEDKEAKS